MSLHVNQRVVCVDDKPFDGYEWDVGEAPTKGAFYTITKIYADGDLPLVELAEIARTELCLMVWGHGGYFSGRFRPVKTTSIEIFRAMLVTPPKEVVDA